MTKNDQPKSHASQAGQGQHHRSLWTALPILSCCLCTSINSQRWPNPAPGANRPQFRAKQKLKTWNPNLGSGRAVEGPDCLPSDPMLVCRRADRKVSSDLTSESLDSGQRMACRASACSGARSGGHVFGRWSGLCRAEICVVESAFACGCVCVYRRSCSPAMLLLLTCVPGEAGDAVVGQGHQSSALRPLWLAW